MTNTFSGASLVREMIVDNSKAMLEKMKLEKNGTFSHHTFETRLQAPIHSTENFTKYSLDASDIQFILYDLYIDSTNVNRDKYPTKITITLENPMRDFVDDEITLCEYDKLYIEKYNKMRKRELCDDESVPHIYLPNLKNLNLHHIKLCNQKINIYVYRLVSDDQFYLFVEFYIPLTKQELYMSHQFLMSLTNQCTRYYCYDKIMTNIVKFNKNI